MFRGGFDIIQKGVEEVLEGEGEKRGRGGENGKGRDEMLKKARKVLGGTMEQKNSSEGGLPFDK